MPNLLLHKDDTGILYHNLQSCSCCPYGYHIDLDFVRYCETLVNARPSDGELLRRDKRLSRKSIEVMLGLDDIYSQWDSTKVQPVQEVPFEIEPDSPRVADKIQDYSYYTFSDSSGTTNGSPEASAFLHDALDDVVSDFERTLERTKKKEKRSSSWGHYIYAVDSCFSGNKSSVKSDVPPTQENDELEPIGDNGSNTNAHALHKIRQQMAISLSRMRDLEEQVKKIPKLQKQLATLNEEKRQLQLQLQKEEALTRKLAKDATCNKIPATFVPQRISPVALESLGSRVRPTSPPEVPKRNLTRDVGVMCTQRRSDVGISVGSVMVRTVGTNPLNTKGISDNLFTKCELDELIKLAIQKFEKDFEYNRRKIKVSVGTQMVQKAKKDVRDSFAQTPPEKMVLKNSVGISAYPSQKHAMVVCKPETRTVASSNDTISDIMCEKCSIIKRTVACGPDDADVAKTSVSLKLMDMPPRSLSFSLGETEKLNIKRKTVGTQYQISVQSKAVQYSPSYDSIGIQNTPICLSKSCQYVSDNINRSTDTFGLVDLLDKYVNTEEEPSKTIETRNVSCNTEEKRTRESATSTIAPSLTSSYSNTDQIQKKDASCGDIIKPHISIACADNYCDSCKDAIKSLAKEFSKVLTSPVLGTTTDQSKIPRPKTLASPRPVRRTFVRQNTYTISTPTPSPKAEKRLLVDESLKKLSSSLDSVSLTGGLPEKSKDGDQLSRSLHEQASVSSTENSPRNKITIQSKITESTSKSVVNGKNGVEKEVPHYREYSPPVQAMFLNQLTSTSSEPRTKATPSKEMKAAMKVINDSLQKSSSKSSNLKSANAIVQKEWFRISSTDKANPLDVEDYLDCFEEISNGVLRHIVNMTDTNGNTAMHYAVSHGNFDVVSILLDSKVCNVNQTNNAGYTCVMLVSLAKLKDSSHRTVVQRLFQMADVNIRARKHCQTALMLAVSHGNLDMVEMLLAAGADINIQDEDGSSALMCAAEHGRIDIVKHLLSQPDCDSLVQDVDGSTAFKIAWQAGHREIGLLLYVHEQMLRSKMPNRSIEQRSPAVPRRQKSQQQPHTQ